MGGAVIGAGPAVNETKDQFEGVAMTTGGTCASTIGRGPPSLM